MAASVTWFATVPHPAKPKGWDITWGAQLDPRVVRVTDDGEITDVAVASYLAKYATKSTEPVGVLPAKITPENASVYARPTYPPGAADRRLPQTRRPPPRGLQSAAPLGPHARLPRPLRYQIPPLLHHLARAGRCPHRRNRRAMRYPDREHVHGTGHMTRPPSLILRTWAYDGSGDTVGDATRSRSVRRTCP